MNAIRMNLLFLSTTFALACAAAFAGMPPTLHYQGKVTVDGQPFDGTGLFQFALVDDGTENVRPARATAIVTNGFVTSVTVDDAGNGYDAAPRVSLDGGGGSGAEAVAFVEDGRVVSISVTSAGSGYTSAPGVAIDEPPPATMKTLWSHDRRSEGGGPPGTFLPVDVRNGIFSVPLGGEGMTPLDPEVFQGSPVFLRVWFDGGKGFEQLRPDFELTSVPFAFQAARAQSIADGALTADAFASGAIGNAMSAEGIGAWAGSGDQITSTRNIGIKTTSPAQALDVAGNIQVSGWIGSAGSQPVELRMQNEPVLRITPAGHSSDPRPNVILGAPSNAITGANTQSATISGGAGNVASDSEAVIGGGFNNTAGGVQATVGGGLSNEATGSISTVGGGFSNRATNIRSTVAGGDRNLASGSRSSVGGGLENTASATAATVPGGADNIASGTYSFAAGRRATAGHSGSFVWSDNSTSVFSSTANNQFLIRAGGGVGIGTNNPAGALHVMGDTVIGGLAEDHRLGVGTDNPWNTLHVVSNADQGPFRVAVGTNNNTAFRIYQNRGTGIGSSWSDSAIPDRGLRVHGQTILGDTVGVNTANPNPDAPLHVKGTATRGLIIESGSNPGGWELRVDNFGEWLIFGHAQNVASGFNGRAYIRDDGTYNRFSDMALKSEVEPVTTILDRVLSLVPVSYRFISGAKNTDRLYGFIAQQVQEVFPEIVNDDEELEFLSLSYENFSVLAIQAIREQQAIINDQAAEIAELRAELAGLAAVAAQNEDLAGRMARIEGWVASLGEEMP